MTNALKEEKAKLLLEIAHAVGKSLKGYSVKSAVLNSDGSLTAVLLTNDSDFELILEVRYDGFITKIYRLYNGNLIDFSNSTLSSVFRTLGDEHIDRTQWGVRANSLEPLQPSWAEECRRIRDLVESSRNKPKMKTLSDLISNEAENLAESLIERFNESQAIEEPSSEDDPDFDCGDCECDEPVEYPETSLLITAGEGVIKTSDPIGKTEESTNSEADKVTVLVTNNETLLTIELHWDKENEVFYYNDNLGVALELHLPENGYIVELLFTADGRLEWSHSTTDGLPLSIGSILEESQD